MAKIGIINAASLDPLGGYRYYRDIFLRYGALEANRITIDVNHTFGNSDPEVIALIGRQTGFFFGGGDPQRAIDMYVTSVSQLKQDLVIDIFVVEGRSKKSKILFNYRGSLVWPRWVLQPLMVIKNATRILNVEYNETKTSCLYLARILRSPSMDIHLRS